MFGSVDPEHSKKSRRWRLPQYVKSLCKMSRILNRNSWFANWRLSMESCVRPRRFGRCSWDELQNRRYSIYSIKDGGERRARGISELRGQESTPWTHKSFIYKQGLISQAGRRGFEPRLPLQFYQWLRPVHTSLGPNSSPHGTCYQSEAEGSIRELLIWPDSQLFHCPAEIAFDAPNALFPASSMANPDML